MPDTIVVILCGGGCRPFRITSSWPQMALKFCMIVSVDCTQLMIHLLWNQENVWVMTEWPALLIPMGTCNWGSVFSYEKQKKRSGSYKTRIRLMVHHSKTKKHAIIYLKLFIKHTYIMHPRAHTIDSLFTVQQVKQLSRRFKGFQMPVLHMGIVEHFSELCKTNSPASAWSGMDKMVVAFLIV